MSFELESIHSSINENYFSFLSDLRNFLSSFKRNFPSSYMFYLNSSYRFVKISTLLLINYEIFSNKMFSQSLAFKITLEKVYYLSSLKSFKQEFKSLISEKLNFVNF